MSESNKDFPRTSYQCTTCGDCKTEPCERPDCGIRPAAADDKPVAWAVVWNKFGVHKLSITRESAERKMLAWKREWPDNDCSVRPLVFGDSGTRPAAAAVEPEWSVDPDGELCMDWYVGSAVLSLSFGGAGKISWAMRDGESKAHGAKEFGRPAAASGEVVHLYRCIGRDERWTTSSQEEIEGLNPDWYEFKVLYTHPAFEVAGEAVQPDAARGEARATAEKAGDLCAAWLDLGKLATGGMAYATAFQTTPKQTALYARSTAVMADGLPPAATPALLGLSDEQMQTLTSIAEWLTSSTNMVQVGPDEQSWASAFDMQLAQAADEISAIIAALKEAP